MTTRERLAKLLEKHGFKVLPEELHPATGWWRSASASDVYRWEGFGTAKNHSTFPDGFRVCFLVGIQ